MYVLTGVALSGETAGGATADRAVLFKAEQDRQEQKKNLVFGRLKCHLGAAILINGYHKDGSRMAFELIDSPPESVFWKPPWMHTGQEDYFRFYAVNTTPKWARYELKLMPKHNGRLEIILCSAGDGGVARAGVENWSLYDNLSCEGATILNGDFEKRQDQQLPGWDRIDQWNSEEGSPPFPTVINDPRVAQSGSRCVRVRDWRGYRTWLENVRKDRPITLTYWARTEAIESYFTVRIGLSSPQNKIKFNTGNPNALSSSDPKVSPGSAFLPVNQWRGEWGPNPVAGSPKWNGKKGAQVFIATAEQRWEEKWFSFIPTADGDIELTLHAVRLVNNDRNVFIPRWVDYDDFQVEGAQLSNGDFEQISEQIPADWERVGADRTSQLLLRNSDLAGSGENFVRLWYQAGLRCKLRNVTARRKVTVRFSARAVPE